MVVVLLGGIFSDDRSLVDRGNVVAGWMAAAISEFSRRFDLEADLLAFSWRNVSFFRRNMFLQRGAHAQASTIPSANHRTRGFWRSPRPDRPDSVYSSCEHAHSGYFLVLGESCRVYVSLYLVSWHVPTIPL